MEPTFQVLPPVPPPPPPPQPPRPPRSFFQNIGAWIVGGVVAVLKYGWLILKSIKVSASIFLMVWTYSWLFGWPFSLCFVFLIFVHEMGHVAAAKFLGMPVNLPMFIPFLGAYTALKGAPQDAYTEALFSSGGVLAGCIGSWFFLVLGLHYHVTWITAVASVSFIVNIFNMIPVPMLDGGGMCAAISPSFWFVGMLLLGLALIYFHSFFASIIIIMIVFMLSLPRLQQTLFEEPTEEMRLYYSTHISNRLTIAILYLGILAALVLGYAQASGYVMSALNA